MKKYFPCKKFNYKNENQGPDAEEADAEESLIFWATNSAKGKIFLILKILSSRKAQKDIESFLHVL